MFLSTGVFRDQGSGFVCTPTIHVGAMFQRMASAKMTWPASPTDGGIRPVRLTRLQMQDAVLDLLGAALVPVLGTDVAAGAAPVPVCAKTPQ